VNSNEKNKLMTLLWKEWRQIRVLILLPALILLTPALIRSGISTHYSMMPAFTLAAGLLATFLTCYAAGVSSYGMEFSGHTTAYLATRPISPAKVFAVKVSLGLLFCFAAALLSRLQVAPGEIEWTVRRSPLLGVWLNRWWVIAPTAYLAVLFVTLVVREQLLALILALLTTWLAVVAAGTGVFLPSLFSLMMVGACYGLASRRREARW